MLAWQPAGDNRTAKVIWEVDFHISECFSEQSSHRPEPVNKTFAIDWSIDEQGLTTRTIDGRIEVPIMTGFSAKGSPSIPGSMAYQQNADYYRKDIRFPIPIGFMRSQKYTLSNDRRSLTFQITDRELPSDFAFYPGTLKMEADQEISSSFQDGNWGGFVKWDCVINATITLPRNVSMNLDWGGDGYVRKTIRNGRRHAWAAFKKILDTKIWTIAAKTKGGLDPGKVLRVPTTIRNVDAEESDTVNDIKEGNACFIPDQISMKEDLYGRTFQFSFSYTIFCMPDRVFEATRIMAPEGPGTGISSYDFYEYLKYVGGDRPGTEPKAAIKGVEGQPFNRRGEIGTLDLERSDATYWGTSNVIPLTWEGYAPWTQEFIYDYCHPSQIPGLHFKLPKRKKPRKSGSSYKYDGVSPSSGAKGAKGAKGEKGPEGTPYYPNPGTNEDSPYNDDNNIKLLGYVCNYTHEEVGAVVMHTRVGQVKEGSYYQDELVSSDLSSQRYRAVEDANQLSEYDRPKIQSLGPPQHSVRVTGYAYQMGYTRLPPSTLKWGKDCTLYRVSKQTTISQVSKGAVPVYLITWDILYNADNSPGGEPYSEARKQGDHTSGLLTNQLS